MLLRGQGGDAPDDAGYETRAHLQQRDTARPRGCDASARHDARQRTAATLAGAVRGAGGVPACGSSTPYDPATHEVLADGVRPRTPRAGRAARRALAVSIGVDFDGWGYAHLYRNGGASSPRSTTYAIPEASTRAGRPASATSRSTSWRRTRRRTWRTASYYSGGLRVVRVRRARASRGRALHRPSGGNDFWGVEQFTAANGERLIAGSDRDYGLYIVRYTGPGARRGRARRRRRLARKAGAARTCSRSTAGQALTGTDVR